MEAHLPNDGELAFEGGKAELGLRAPRFISNAENLRAHFPDGLSRHDRADCSALQFPSVKRIVAA